MGHFREQGAVAGRGVERNMGMNSRWRKGSFLGVFVLIWACLASPGCGGDLPENLWEHQVAVFRNMFDTRVEALTSPGGALFDEFEGGGNDSSYRGNIGYVETWRVVVRRYGRGRDADASRSVQLVHVGVRRKRKGRWPAFEIVTFGTEPEGMRIIEDVIAELERRRWDYAYVESLEFSKTVDLTLDDIRLPLSPRPKEMPSWLWAKLRRNPRGKVFPRD